jgi:hypothetical protein
VLVLLALVLPFCVVSALPASATAASEFVSRTNGARTSRGLRAYTARSDLASVAQRQAARMAAQRSLFHNPNLGSDVSGWRSLGENVGRGSSVSAIHDAFMASSSHRANILSGTFTEIGVGTATGGDGLLYVSEVFRQPNGATYTAPAPAPARTAPTRTTRTTRRTGPSRASRSAPRRPLPRVVAPPRRRVVPDPTLTNLRAAWRLYRKARPVSSVDRVVMYSRTGRLLVR